MGHFGLRTFGLSTNAREATQSFDLSVQRLASVCGLSNARVGVNVNRVNVIGEILRRFGLSQGGGLRPGIILLDPPTWCEPRWCMYMYDWLRHIE